MSYSVSIDLIDTVTPFENNPRQITPDAISKVAKSIELYGFRSPIVVDDDRIILAGHTRLLAAQKLGLSEVPVHVATGLSKAKKRAYRLADNRSAEESQWDFPMLTEELGELNQMGFNLADTLFDPDEINGFLNFDLESENDEQIEKGSLSKKFGVSPFSVLNAREGWWQEKKRSWLSLGIKSEMGRNIAPTSVPDNLPENHYMAGRGNNEGGSIFDPVLCELAYSWFSPKDGIILDPFAGGSVRGVIASHLGRQYIGHELRGEQVEANRLQASEICKDPQPVWHTGDSRNIAKNCSDVKADFVFSCPPYADLEVYSDDPNDLSNMDYDKFLNLYREIINQTCLLLNENRFACFVVGDIRDKKGNYRNFVGDTVEAFRLAGLHFYNEAILVTAVGSLPIRAGRTFSKSRKLGKTHQNVLVFVKGDGKKAAQACGNVEVHIDDDLGEEL